LSESALAAGVKRVVFTTELPSSKINETTIPEFQNAINLFAKASSTAAFTGIRHGQVIPGDENFPYEIYNSSIPLLESTVERGVLARVAAELLCIDKAANSECGLSSSGDFAAGYLNVLRSSGLTRRQEVTKMFSGGLQRVARLTVDEYEAERKRAEDRKAQAEARRAEIAAGMNLLSRDRNIVLAQY